MSLESVWVFHGADGRFASGIFVEKMAAERWISTNKLTGVLTEYPLNTGVYDWALQKGYFFPKTEEHTSSVFIGKFTTASQEHFHYEDGKLA